MKIGVISSGFSVSDYNHIYGNISDHAKTVFANQVKGIAYSFKSLYESYSPKIMRANEKLLKELGITKIGNCVSEGITFSGEKYNHVVSFPDNGVFKLAFEDKNTGRVAREFIVEGNKTKYTYSGHNKNDDIEDTIEELLDNIDSKLFHFRRNVKSTAPSQFIPPISMNIKTPMSRSLTHTLSLNPGTTKMYNDLLDPIKDNYDYYMEHILKLGRYSKKSAAFKKIHSIISVPRTRGLVFTNITPEGDDLHLSFPTFKSHRGIEVLVMKDRKIKDTYLILDDKLVRYKRKNILDPEFKYNRNMKYFNQEEINNSKLRQYLKLINSSLNSIVVDLKGLLG